MAAPMSDPDNSDLDGLDGLGSGSTLVRPSQPELPIAGAGAFQPPRRLGSFVLERMLGRGGMAAVFLATEEPSGRPVALKLMDPNLRADPAFVERFVHEATSCASLHHPNITEVYSWGEKEGWHYLACEYVEGGTLSGLLSAMGALPSALAAELLAQLLSGLSHAHQAGIVHRDLKPENLLLTTGGILKIADFGIARTAEGNKLTKTGMLLGTAGYMSPEQAKGLKVDSRSDLFTTGIILYEMLTGINPFDADSAATSITRILGQKAPPIFEVKPTAPVELEVMLGHLWAFDPQARFASAQDALAALMPFIAERRRTQPTLVSECIKRPKELKQQLDAQASVALVGEVRELVNGNALELNRAAIKLHYALELDAGNAEAKRLLGQVSGRMAVNFGPTRNPKVSELESLLAEQPDNSSVLAQLAQLYKMEGNLVRAANYLKRYLKLKPNDAYTANQLFQLTGERPNKVSGTALIPAPGSTAELTAGVKTGGFKSMRPSAPSALRQQGTQSMAVTTGVHVDAVAIESPLKRQLLTIGGVLVAGVVAVLVVRGVSRKIDKTMTEADRQAEALRAAPSNPTRVDPGEAPVATAHQARNFDREATELFDSAAAAERKGDVTQALTLYEKYAVEFPKRAQLREAKFRRSKMQLLLRRNAEARVGFDEFLTQFTGSPDAAEALLRRGEAAALNLDDLAALADYDAFITQHPSSALINEAFVLRGEVRARKGDPEGAKADFQQVLGRLAPADPLYERANSGLKVVP